MGTYLTEIEDLDIIVEKNIEFNKLNESEYITLFKSKIDEGIIKKGTDFFSDMWIITVGGVEKIDIFPTEIQFKKLSKMFNKPLRDFELAYRIFFVMNLNIYFSISELNKYFRKVSINFKDAKLSNRFVGALKGFFEFIKIPEETYELFKENIENIDNPERNPRRLPEVEDILKFSDIINDIIENKDILEYKSYLLTIMWWKICSILPLRPSEFLRINFKCIYKEENKFYLKVKRTKAKTKYKKDIKNLSKVDEYYLDDTVNIDKGLFNFIKKYQNILINEFNYKKELELFPVEILSDIRINDRKHRKINFNIITANELYDNMERFYRYIIKKQYGLNPINEYVVRDKNSIEKLSPYSARHIAIINLILLGTDVLEVMYLAGHTRINTAYSYFNHIKEFSRGYALGYAKKLKDKGKMEDSLIEVSRFHKSKGSEDFERVLGVVRNEKYEPKRVKGGYCYYRNIDSDKFICFKYERNHSICEYFVPEKKEVLELRIKQIEDGLDADIKVLKDLIQDMKFISKFNELYQTTSYRISKSIQELSHLNKKLMMEE